jgi:hypothetical protein
VLACFRIKAPGERKLKLWKSKRGKPTQTWCPIKDGIPGEKVINEFDVIELSSDDDEDDEDYDFDEEE